MRYQLLGKSGLRVSELCLGTMTFGETWGWGASKEVSQQMFDLFADAGGNFIDTSVNYTDGTSEEFIGEFIQADRDYFIVATKYTLTKQDSTNPNSGGNSRKNMMKSVETSLKRLKTDYLDVLYLHAWDYMTPIEEVMRGLDDLVRMGKVNYIAISDTPAYIVSAANMLSELRGWSRFVGLQVPYSLLSRDIERDLLPMAQHWDMAVMPWGVIGGGLLTGKYTEDTDEPTRYNKDDINAQLRSESLRAQRIRSIVEAVKEVSDETGYSRAQVAINWVRQQQHLSQMIPILGSRTVKHLVDNLAVLEWELTEEQHQKLTDSTLFELGFPHTFLLGNPYIFGATYDKIDRHR